MSNFWDVVVLTASTFVFVAYVVLVFHVILDLVFHVILDLTRDSTMGGGSKALWIAGRLVIPLLTPLVCLLVCGSDLAERRRRA